VKRSGGFASKRACSVIILERANQSKDWGAKLRADHFLAGSLAAERMLAVADNGRIDAQALVSVAAANDRFFRANARLIAQYSM